MMGSMHGLVVVVAKYLVIVPVAALAYIFLRLDKKRRLEFFVFLTASVVLTALLVKLATTLHQDPRPFVSDGVKPYFVGSTDNGFPSDHTTFSAVIAFVVLRYSRWLGIGLAVLSLLIGTCRVIAGVHHAQDVIGGFAIAALGAGLGLLAQRAAMRFATNK